LSSGEVQIIVNGQEIGRHKLELNNDRTFGFFRYADRSAVRIRNVVCRGHWPSVAPAVADQELAIAQ
jgi:hypothetical protein